MTAATAELAGISPTVYRRRWWILVALCLSLLIIFVGNTSLNVAIPTLSRELHATESQLQWVIAAYSLVFAGLLFTAGAIGDRYGRKGALQFGLIVFLISCIGATLSHSTWQLIACRGLMGVGAAFIMPSTLSRELGASTAQLQWVIAAYSLVFAGLLFTSGALGDRYGRKGALQLGLVIFLAGSIVAVVIARYLRAVGPSPYRQET